MLGAQTLYVSTQGRDGWSGRLPAPNAQGSDGPLRSLEAARDAVRTLKKNASGGPITVLLRKGEYHLTQPFVLTPEDSGAPARPIVYAAYPGEHPVLCGGRVIEGWKKGAKNIWTAEIADVKEGRWYFRQLFANGARATRARTPNYGFYRTDGAPAGRGGLPGVKFRGSDIREEWAGLGDVELVGLSQWQQIRVPIGGVDEQTHMVTFGAGRSPLVERDSRYFIENALDLLDEGNEWYLDRKTGILSYFPVTGENPSQEEIVAPVLYQLVRLEGQPEQGKFIRNVTFRGLRFCHTDWNLGPNGYRDSQNAVGIGAVFEGVGAEDCSIEDCVFTHHGDFAIWFGRGSQRDRVVGNEIFDMGGGGVKIGDTVQRQNEAEQSMGNVVTDNHIHDLGAVYTTAPGVWVGQSGNNTISHNHIHDLYQNAIAVGWTWGYGANQSKGNHIDYNDLHDLGKEMTSDLGAIYTLGMQPGTTIRNNLIHDVSGFTYGGWGIYPDEGSSEMLIENNIVYRCSDSNFHQHYGRDNIVRNNIFAFGGKYELMRTRIEQTMAFTFENNIVYFDHGRLLGDNWADGRFRMSRNLYWDSRGGEILFGDRTFDEWKAAGQDAGSIVADPLFVDPANFNFNLRPGSPALKLGFKQIDMSTVGPRRRASASPGPRTVSAKK
jgi:hypothetical protein